MRENSSSNASSQPLNDSSSSSNPLSLSPTLHPYSSASLKRGNTIQALLVGGGATLRKLDSRMESARGKAGAVHGFQMATLSAIGKYAESIEESTKRRKQLEEAMASIYLATFEPSIPRSNSGMLQSAPSTDSAVSFTSKEEVFGAGSKNQIGNPWDQSKLGFLAGNFCNSDAFLKCSEGVDKRLMELNNSISSCREICENLKATFRERLSMHDSFEEKYEKMRKKSQKVTKGFNNLKELSDLKNAFEDFRDALLQDLDNYFEQRQDPLDPALLALAKLQKEMSENINSTLYVKPIETAEKRIETVPNSVKTTFLFGKAENPTFLNPETIDFESFLNHEICLIYFKNFLESEYSLENLLFHLQMKEWTALPNGPFKSTEALRIYNSFVKEGSLSEVNISSPTKESVRKALSTHPNSAVSSVNNSPRMRKSIELSKSDENLDLGSVLERPWKEVLMLMKTDSFDRFKKSPYFTKLQERLTARNYRNFSVPILFVDNEKPKNRLQRGGSISSMSGAEDSSSPIRSPSNNERSPDIRNFFSDSLYPTSPSNSERMVRSPSPGRSTQDKETRDREREREKEEKREMREREREEKRLAKGSISKSSYRSNGESRVSRFFGTGSKRELSDTKNDLKNMMEIMEKEEKEKEKEKEKEEEPKESLKESPKEILLKELLREEETEEENSAFLIMTPPPSEDKQEEPSTPPTPPSKENAVPIFLNPTLPMKLSEEALKRRSDYHGSRSVSMTHYSSSSERETGSTTKLRSRFFPQRKSSLKEQKEEQISSPPSTAASSTNISAQVQNSVHAEKLDSPLGSSKGSSGSIWKTISVRLRGKKTSEGSSPELSPTAPISPKTNRNVTSLQAAKEKEKDNRKSIFHWGKKKKTAGGKEMAHSNSLDYASYGSSPFNLDSPPLLSPEVNRQTQSVSAFPQLPPSLSADSKQSLDSNGSVEDDGNTRKVKFAVTRRRSASSLSNSESQREVKEGIKPPIGMGFSMKKSKSEIRPRVESPEKNVVRERSITTVNGPEKEVSTGSLVNESTRKENREKRRSIRDEFLVADAKFSEATQRRNAQREARKKQREEELRLAEETSRLNEEKRRIREENRRLQEDQESAQLAASKKNQDERRKRLVQLES